MVTTSPATDPRAGTVAVPVMHLITGLDVGGAERVLVRLVTSLDRQRFPTTVVSLLGEGPLVAPLRAAGVEVVTLDMPRGLPTLRGIGRLLNLLRKKRPRVLQTWLYHADLIGIIAARLARTPTTFWNLRAGDVDALRERAQFRWTMKLCARLSAWPSAVVVNSDAGRQHHQRLGYHPRQWVVIENGIDISAFRPDDAARHAVRHELGIGPTDPVIGLVARLDPLKDHETFLRAAATLAASRPDVHFVLAGEGVSEQHPEFAELRRRAGATARILALGRRDDIPRLLAAFDVATCSSITEGFPNVVIEGMACGVPCVVTDVGDVAAIVADTGLVVPPGNPAAMATAWKQLIEWSGSDRRALGLRARARVAEHYSLERMVGAYEALYRHAAPTGNEGDA